MRLSDQRETGRPGGREEKERERERRRRRGGGGGGGGGGGLRASNGVGCADIGCAIAI